MDHLAREFLPAWLIAFGIIAHWIGVHSQELEMFFEFCHKVASMFHWILVLMNWDDILHVFMYLAGVFLFMSIFVLLLQCCFQGTLQRVFKQLFFIQLLLAVILVSNYFSMQIGTDTAMTHTSQENVPVLRAPALRGSSRATGVATHWSLSGIARNIR
jgi:hypothetical protein